MVLSASSVYSYRAHDGDSYAVVKRQLMWVLLGLPCAWVASRLPHAAPAARLARPARLAGAARADPTSSASSVNGNTNWLALGPVQIQPSEIAKLAVVLWAAHVYAHKERRLGSLHQILMPVVPGMLLVDRAGRRRPRPRHRAGALRDPARHALGGRRPGPAVRVRACRSSASPRSAWPTTSAERRERLTTSPTRSRTTTTRAGSPPTASTPVHRRLVRPGHRRQPAEVGRPARGPHRLHLRGARRGARPGRHPAGARAVPHHRLRRDPGRRAHRGPVRPLHVASASWSGCSAR